MSKNTQPTTHYIGKVEKDPDSDDLILTFPPDVLAQVGWNFGDTLTWHDNNDGTWTLTKKDTDG